MDQLPCASASVSRYTALASASVSNPAASVLASVSTSSVLVTTLGSVATFYTRQSLQQSAAKQTAGCSRTHPTG